MPGWSRPTGPTPCSTPTAMIRSSATDSWSPRPAMLGSRWPSAPPGGSARTTVGGVCSVSANGARTARSARPCMTIWWAGISPRIPQIGCGWLTLPNTAPLGFLGWSQRLDGEEVMALSDRLVGGLGLPRYSASQREVFFRLLDRGGTIRAAAVGAGVSPDTGYRWRRQAGVAARRQRPRTYTAEEKAEFFRLLHIRGNVSAVARELGYVRVTCYKWAHQAGIFTGKDVSDKREEFLRLRSEGVSRRQAAEQVGVDKRTAQDWDKGIRQFYGGRVYPDGRVVKYRPAAILANVKNPRNTYGHNDNRDVLERLERSISPRFLSLTEREQIHDLKATGLSIRQIGHQLSRAPSTISRELRRNATQSL